MLTELAKGVPTGGSREGDKFAPLGSGSKFRDKLAKSSNVYLPLVLFSNTNVVNLANFSVAMANFRALRAHMSPELENVARLSDSDIQ